MGDGNFLGAIPKKDVAHILDIVDAAADIMRECPASLDKATVPKAGIEAAPNQVVIEMSIAYPRWKRLKDALEASGQNLSEE